MVATDVRFNVFSNSNPGENSFVALYTDSNCTNDVGEVTPVTLGPIAISFGPGLAIPAGNALYAEAFGSVATALYVDGYTVPSSAVPAVGQTIQLQGSSRHSR